jgi:DNA modification methylase
MEHSEVVAVGFNTNITRIGTYIESELVRPLFIKGDALTTLRMVPDGCIDCCMTSPLYFGQRQYSEPGIGREGRPEQYLSNLLAIIAEIKRVLKPSGSFWLNLGDAYPRKGLLLLPERLLIAMSDVGWIVRNKVIWSKGRGCPDSSRDKLRNSYEYAVHFVKKPRCNS